MKIEFVPEHCWKIVPELNPPAELPPESRLIIVSGTESIQIVSSHRCLLPTAIVDYKIINDPNCCSYPAMYDIPLPLLRIISLSQIQNEIDDLKGTRYACMPLLCNCAVDRSTYNFNQINAIAGASILVIALSIIAGTHISICAEAVSTDANIIFTATAGFTITNDIFISGNIFSDVATVNAAIIIFAAAAIIDSSAISAALFANALSITFDSIDAIFT